MEGRWYALEAGELHCPLDGLVSAARGFQKHVNAHFSRDAANFLLRLTIVGDKR